MARVAPMTDYAPAEQTDIGQNFLTIDQQVFDVKTPNSGQNVIGTGTSKLTGSGNLYRIYAITREAKSIETKLSRVFRVTIWASYAHTGSLNSALIKLSPNGIFGESSIGGQRNFIAQGVQYGTVGDGTGGWAGYGDVLPAYVWEGNFRFVQIFQATDKASRWVVRFEGLP